MNKIEKDWAAWQEREQRIAAIYPKGTTEKRHFRQLKHREFLKMYRKHRGTARTLDERVSLSMLRAANKDMEKALYPNRVERYTRRLFRAVGNGVRRLGSRITAGRNARRQPATSIWIDPQLSKPVTVQNKAPVVRRVSPRKTTPTESLRKSKGIKR